MAEFSRLPTQEELSRMLYQMQLGNRSQQDIINENLAKGSTVKPIPDNIFQKMAGGAQTAKEQVNKLGNMSDIAKLFPGYTGQSQVTIPTDYNLAPKQDVYGGLTPQGMQTKQVNIDQLLKAIKPADVIGLTGAQQAYSDIGMGKAPKPMDVLDIAGLGVTGLGAGKGLLGVAKATKGLPVGMSIKDVTDLSYRSTHEAPSPDFGAPLHDLTGGGQMYPADVYSSKAAQYYGTGFDKADREAFALANSVRGNPNAMVTMYRAVPKELSNSEKLAKIEKDMATYMKRKTLPKDANTNDGSKWYDFAYDERERLRKLPDEPSKNIDNINAGDWVTLTKDYAKQHGESVLNGNYKIISKKVKAKDLWTNADSIQEFGYNPSE